MPLSPLVNYVTKNYQPNSRTKIGDMIFNFGLSTVKNIITPHTAYKNTE